ncbi:MAG: adenosylcobinamide-GDP ribazoletransferase [Veillonellales bacterium]
MKAFITGLQFLTRIRIANQTDWAPEEFGRSVKYFPLVGGVIGLILVAVNYLLDVYLPLLGVAIPPHVFATILAAMPILLTGGLHCDGFMDTMDGILSGRPSERMLEIMKDSRVGASGVTAFFLLFFFKWSILMDISPSLLPLALFTMPVLARLAMVIGITCFPYARPEGMGKAFANFANRKTLYWAICFTAVLIVPIGIRAIISAVPVLLLALLFARYSSRLLGGLTGDVYGAISELAEVLVLLTFSF